MHEEAVERARQGLYAVVVADQREGRLRLARGENPLRCRAARCRAAGSDRPRDLREDVERVAVARVLERTVPGGIDRLQAFARDVLGRVDRY